MTRLIASSRGVLIDTGRRTRHLSVRTLESRNARYGSRRIAMAYLEAGPETAMQ